MSRHPWIAVWTLLFIPPATLATMRYVPSGYTSIQAAIVASSNGDTVLVDHNTYVENIDFLGKSIVVGSLLLTTGDTSHISQTIIDGGGSAASKPVVTFQGSEDGSTLLRGFTITNGYATGTHGGGISLTGGARPRIEDCRIAGNTGLIGYRLGIGISCTGSSPTISRCLISNNTASGNGNNDQMGGGIYVAASSSPKIVDCSITNNTPGNGWGRNYGGGVYCSASTPEFRNCTIAGNAADLGGGILALNSSSVSTYNCVVDGNSAGANGGGVASYSSSVVQLDSCFVTRNSAGSGGGCYMEGNGRVNATRSTITDNSATNGAGLYANTGTIPTLTNCIVWYNWPYEIYPSTLTQITYCDVRAGYQGTGNLDIDPLFCDWLTRQFTLASNSACLTGGSGGTRMGCFPSGCTPITPKTRKVPADYATIQDAIFHAYQGDTILVATGTRAENPVFWGRRVLLTSQYTLSGDTSHIGQTVLNGGGSGVNKSVVSLNEAEDSLCVLRGFTITNGYASGTHGGGMTLANNARPRIEDCRIVGNTGLIGYRLGIGIACTGSSPTIRRCLISNNTASGNGNNDQMGGGIYIAASSSPKIIDCSITNNTPGNGAGRNFGGGVYCASSSPAFRNCTIAGNAADLGGGILALNSSSVSTYNCVVDGNSAGANGGGVASYSSSVVQLDSCFVTRNYAGGNGGALYMENSAKVNAVRTTITDNTAALGAGVYAASGTTPTLTNCIIWYNWFNEITPSSLTQVTYCDIRGGYQGTGNLDIDPLFCDWLTRQFTLASNSLSLTGGSGGGRMGYFPSGCTPITPKTRKVPADYATIQDAIFHAYQGDTILVATGTRTENPVFWGRRVLLTSQYTLSGDTSHIGQTVLNGGGSSVNKSVVSLVEAEDSLCVLKGFTITNGYASGTHGGGVTIANGSRPRIEDCRIIGNAGTSGSMAGIGIYCASSSPKISRCVISNNSAPINGNNDHNGGGVYIGSSSSPVFRGCSISNNSIAFGVNYRNYGGGIYCDNSSSEFRNCRIAGNVADLGGGIRAVNSSSLVVYNCVIDSNTARANGGAVASYTSSVVQLDSSFVTRNYAPGNGGGLYMEGNGRVNATRSTITDNTAAMGAGVYAAGGTAPTFTNCIIWYNWFNEISPSTLTQVTYCDIRGGYQGTGNLDIDPLFCDWLTRQFSLASNSACLTGGSAGSKMGCFPSGCTPITPKTRKVPLDYTTIQDAIFHAYQGDTILVATGTRAENPVFWGRRVLLTSQYTLSGDTAHIGQTILNGGGSTVNKSVVSLDEAEDSLCVLRGFTITNGYASGTHGGGVTIANNSRPRIEDCRIIGNTGAAGTMAGIGIYCASSSPKISRCVISSNTAPTNSNNDHMGGGVYIASSSAPVLRGCSISNNSIAFTINYRNYGGAVYCNGSSPLFDSCSFTNNTADRGGGICLTGSSNAKLFYCLVVNNQSRAWGGGLYSENSTPTSVNNTFFKNSGVNGGGALYCTNSTTSLMNTICWRDTAAGAQEVTSSGGSITVAYSDVQGGWTGAGVGNMDADPLFENESWFHLTANSPCVDAGNPDPGYNDRPDPARPGFALYPAMGGLRNDMGAYGGSGLTVFIPLGVGDQPDVTTNLPLRFELGPNYPNPFNPATVVSYQLPAVSDVRLVVYDLLGREVAVLVNEKKAPGEYEVRFDGSGLSSGVYLYRLTAGDFVQTRKMVIVK